jgi:hypothetical protein
LGHGGDAPRGARGTKGGRRVGREGGREGGRGTGRSVGGSDGPVGARGGRREGRRAGRGEGGREERGGGVLVKGEVIFFSGEKLARNHKYGGKEGKEGKEEDACREREGGREGGGEGGREDEVGERWRM